MKTELLPRPREIHERAGQVDLTGARVVTGHSGDQAEARAAELIGDLLGSGGGPASVRIGDDAAVDNLPDHPQGYVLSIDDGGVRLRGTTAAGTLHGAHTLRQLIRGEGTTLPHLTIRDWPALDHRGLFVECKWGPDLMGLDDWKRVVDYCAEVKFNHLGVGVYGCWIIQYDDRITEFLMLPLPEVPGAETRKRIEYHSPAAGGTRAIEYVPRMFEEDFFGELVAYGRSQGVTVRPQFNSLGHNTLIPRLVPGVSAKEPDGQPTGYGYCLSSPETESLVFGIYDRILDTYLFPNGVSSFHVGLDEVWTSVGIDADDKKRVRDPWCKCPECSKSTPEQLFCNWVIKLCGHLAERGVEQIGIWNDQLTRHMNLLDSDLVRRMEEAGFKDRLDVEWWAYRPKPIQTDLRAELGLSTWVVPMAGYYHWWPLQSYLENIQGMLRLGLEQGSTGTESYCTFDPAFERNYRYLSQLSWNPDANSDPASFKDAYARWMFDGREDRGAAALAALDRAISEGDVADLTRTLMPYTYTYVRANLPYPRHYPSEVLGILAQDRDASRRKLGEIGRAAAEARLAFQELSDGSPLVAEYLAESDRIEAIASAFLTIMEVEDLLGAREPDRARVAGRLRSTVQRWDAMMATVEAVKEPYLLPQIMRELTTVRTYLVRLLDAVESGAALEPSLPVAVAAGDAGVPTTVAAGNA